MISTLNTLIRPPAEPLQVRFLALLPRIEAHAHFAFRDIRCPHTRADFVAEAVALAWKWFVRLAMRGKDAAYFPSALATFAARAVRGGRRVAGMAKGRDALNPLAQRWRGFTVGPLPDFDAGADGPLSEALRDNAMTPPDEQAAFRIDFAVWLGGWGGRDLRLIRGLALGERALDLARRYGISKARVSQKRQQFRRDWECFVADPEDADRAVPRERVRRPNRPARKTVRVIRLDEFDN